MSSQGAFNNEEKEMRRKGGKQRTSHFPSRQKINPHKVNAGKEDQLTKNLKKDWRSLRERYPKVLVRA